MCNGGEHIQISIAVHIYRNDYLLLPVTCIPIHVFTPYDPAIRGRRQCVEIIVAIEIDRME